MGYPKVWGSLDLFASLWETEIKYKILRGDVFTCGADRGQLKEFLERMKGNSLVYFSILSIKMLSNLDGNQYITKMFHSFLKKVV